MNDSPAEPTISQLSAKIDEIEIGFRWMLSCFLLIVSIPNFCVSFSIEKFHQIFQNALPGKPLSLLTVAVISCPILLHLLALAWPVLGILNIVYGKRIRNWVIGTGIFVFLIGLQALLTWMACILPLGNLFVGISDAGAK